MTAKQECKDCNKSLEGCKCIEDTIEFTEADIETFIDWVFNPAEPNQALIDAAKNHSNQTIRDDSEKSFIVGAKWQQERSYSEEDMIEFGFSTYCYISELMGVPFNLISENRLNAEDWFEQFKKK